VLHTAATTMFGRGVAHASSVCLNSNTRLVYDAKPRLRMPAVADYISSIDVSELRGLVHGAAAGGAEHVSA
jgi:hypothetical protein